MTDEQHHFSPAVVVPNPTPALIQAIQDRRLHAPEGMAVGSGISVKPRRVSPYGTGIAPNPTVFRLPAALAEETYELQVQAEEWHRQGFGYVICSGTGSPLPALPSRYLTLDTHRASRFSAATLSRVSWLKDFETGKCRLQIERATATVRTGQIEVTRESLLANFSVEPSLTAAPSLPPEHSAWQLAVQSLYQRLTCTKPGCGAHFAA